MKNSENYKKIHIVTNSIVKINLSNMPKLSHFREIGENLGNLIETQVLSKWKYPHSDIHEGAIDTAAGRPVHHWRHHHHQASGWPIASTTSERRRVNHQKAFLWPITESANDQGKKIKILTKLTLV
jgi:hypothetical protein